MDRIPARAAIDESVELAKQAGHRFASGMVNAVLRKLGAAPPFHFLEESIAELALAQAHPAWMVERWASFYGLEAARAICRHGQSQPALTVRLVEAVNDGQAPVEVCSSHPFRKKMRKGWGTQLLRRNLVWRASFLKPAKCSLPPARWSPAT